MHRISRYVHVPGCLATSLGDEVIVLTLGSGVYHGLNPVAACVWNCLATPRTLDELVAAVENEFESSGSDVEGDVRRLLDTLCSHGIVTEVGVETVAA
jgi:hypothetical protein